MPLVHRKRIILPSFLARYVFRIFVFMSASACLELKCLSVTTDEEQVYCDCYLVKVGTSEYHFWNFFWQVIFLALDAHVKNVVCTYSLEHNSTSDLFGSVFHFLEELMVPKENISKLFQELVYCIGILQTYIHKHMLKEEKQVAVCNISN